MFKTPPCKTKRNVSPSVKSSSSAAAKKETVKAKVQELLNQLEHSDNEDSSSAGEEVEDEEVEDKEESEASQEEEEEEEEAGEAEDDQDEEEEAGPSEAEASEDDDEEDGEGEDPEEDGKEVKAEEKQAQLALAVEASEAKTANLRNSYTSGLATISCKGFPYLLVGVFWAKADTAWIYLVWLGLGNLRCHQQERLGQLCSFKGAIQGFMNFTIQTALSYSTCGWTLTNHGTQSPSKSIENMSFSTKLSQAIRQSRENTSWKNTTRKRPKKWLLPGKSLVYGTLTQIFLLMMKNLDWCLGIWFVGFKLGFY